jgi:hypothetical protein
MRIGSGDIFVAQVLGLTSIVNLGIYFYRQDLFNLFMFGFWMVAAYIEYKRT